VICIVANLFTASPRVPKQKGREIVTAVLVPVFFWCLIVSLVVRPAIALTQAQGRNPELLHEAGKVLLGEKPHKVYLNEYELYYTGRSLGWKMYNFFGIDIEQYILSHKDNQTVHTPTIFPRIDYILTKPKVMENPNCSEIACKLVDRLGFKKRNTSQFPSVQRGGQLHQQQTSGVNSAQTYESFVVYQRQ
jgi:hypothetical protein